MTKPTPDLVPPALKFGANQLEFRNNADNLVANFPQLQAAAAQFSLGKMYMDGLGVTQDQPQAVTWFRQAADQGHAGAQRMLGVMYE
jgi:TPR repeat protein